MDKYIDFVEQGDLERLFVPYYLPVFSRSFEKQAGDIYVPDKIVNYIEKLKPRDEGRYIHLIALGAGDYWGCFPAGTKVTVTNGFLPIETLKPGQKVLTHRRQWKKITNVQTYPNKKDRLLIYTNELAPVECTPEHPFLVQKPGNDFDEWVEAKDLKVDYLVTRALPDITKIKITKIETYQKDDDVYNLEVLDDNSYVAGNLVVHNCNRKGDYFSEDCLLSRPPEKDICDKIEKRGIKIPSSDDYGLVTFETNAYPFRNHNNKHPSLTTGEKVCCAAYNDKMHRVELIVFVKASDIVDQIDRGADIPWSMGSKVSHDRCSICGNIAKTTKEYCEHAANSLGKVMDDGRKVFVYNDFPKFFDISHVFIPADKSAWSIRKVANFGYTPKEIDMDDIKEKQAQIKKENEIKKTVPATGPSKNLGKAPIPENTIEKAKKQVAKDGNKADIHPEFINKMKKLFGVDGTVKGLTSGGVILRPHEAGHLLEGKPMPDIGKLKELPMRIMDMLKDILPERSMFGGDKGPLQGRMMRISIMVMQKPKGEEKKASYETSAKSYYNWLNKVDFNDIEEAINTNPVLMDMLGREKEKYAGLYIDVKPKLDYDFYLPFVLELKNLSDNLY